MFFSRKEKALLPEPLFLAVRLNRDRVDGTHEFRFESLVAIYVVKEIDSTVVDRQSCYARINIQIPVVFHDLKSEILRNTTPP